MGSNHLEKHYIPTHHNSQDRGLVWIDVAHYGFIYPDTNYGAGRLTKSFGPQNGPNVGKYSIHGAYVIYRLKGFCGIKLSNNDHNMNNIDTSSNGKPWAMLFVGVANTNEILIPQRH